ncbi:delta(24)-sterol reductase, partial [Tanacetum coccineum]
MKTLQNMVLSVQPVNHGLQLACEILTTNERGIFKVDLSAFCNILDIDLERMVAKCEPLVTMGQLTRVTVPMNLALAVVPELDDLTVGGLINGSGLEG